MILGFKTASEKNVCMTDGQIQDKIDGLEKSLEEQQKLSEERLDQIKYLQADFDNYRKNFEKEKMRIIETANEVLIKDLLAVLDDFEAAIMSVESKNDMEGILMMQKKLYRILESSGLRVIETGGKFNPDVHEAVLKEKSNKEEGVILECLQKGFMFKSNVIRPARVKISEGGM